MLEIIPALTVNQQQALNHLGQSSPPSSAEYKCLTQAEAAGGRKRAGRNE
jgi:hypothetical protein